LLRIDVFPIHGLQIQKGGIKSLKDEENKQKVKKKKPSPRCAQRENKH